MYKFTPDINEMCPITIRVERGKLERLDCLAHKYDISRSNLINQCIDYALEDYIPGDR